MNVKAYLWSHLYMYLFSHMIACTNSKHACMHTRTHQPAHGRPIWGPNGNQLCSFVNVPEYQFQLSTRTIH